MTARVVTTAEILAEHPAAASEGCLAAEADIRIGHLRFIRVWPAHCYTPADWVSEYDLLVTRLGIGPTADYPNPYPDPTGQHVFQTAYNERMSAEIENRFGTGILWDLARQAELMYAAKLADMSRSGCNTQPKGGFPDVHDSRPDASSL